MKIQIGEIYMDKVGDKTLYPNKTRKYLLPCFREYGELFITKLNSVFKVAIGIGDIIVENSGRNHFEKHIFILLDTTIAKKFFVDFLEWIKDQPMYEDDYVYDNIQKSTFHMVILTIPEKLLTSFEEFKKGNYSNMFSKEQINVFFELHPEIKKVLIKDHQYRIIFTKKLNRKYNSTVKSEDWEGELDFPPTPETDIFNHHLKK